YRLPEPGGDQPVGHRPSAMKPAHLIEIAGEEVSGFRYRPRGIRFRALALTAAIHIALGAGLLTYHFNVPTPVERVPLMVQTVELAPPPAPEPEKAPPKPQEREIPVHTPKPAITLPSHVSVP